MISNAVSSTVDADRTKDQGSGSEAAIIIGVHHIIGIQPAGAVVKSRDLTACLFAATARASIIGERADIQVIYGKQRLLLAFLGLLLELFGLPGGSHVMQVGLMLGFERGPRRIQIVRVMRLRCIGTIRFVWRQTGVDDFDEVPESCPLPGGLGCPSALLFWFSVITVTLIRRPANG